MGIKVTALREKLKGGGARPSLFYSKISFPQTLINGTAPNGKRILGLSDQEESQISFFMQNAVIPESTIQMIQQPFLGRQVKFPSIDRDFGVFTTTIINDEDYKVRNFFESWIEVMAPGQAIFEGTSSFGKTDNQVFGSLEVHQMKKDGNVSEFEDNGKVSFLGSYYFIDAFPTTVGEISLDWSTQNQIETFTVNFEYQYWIKNPENKSDNNTPIRSKNPFISGDEGTLTSDLEADSWVPKQSAG